MDQHANKLDENGKNAIQRACEAIEKAIKDEDIRGIRRAVGELNPAVLSVSCALHEQAADDSSG